MSILQIVRYPSKILRQISEPVVAGFDCDKLIKKFDDMEDTLEAQPNGLALAANQVGFTERLIVFRQNEKVDIEPWIMNPIIETHDPDKVEMDEGCLSLPGYWRKVPRWQEISVRYEVFTRTSREERVGKFSGLAAQVWQHEVDHLNGVLFVDDLPYGVREKIAMGLGKKR